MSKNQNISCTQMMLAAVNQLISYFKIKLFGGMNFPARASKQSKSETNIIYNRLAIFFLTAIALLFSTSIFAQSSTKYIQNEIKKLFKNKFFTSSLAAVDVYDLTAQKTLYKKNNKLLLHPASNMKILTSAAALKFLGYDYQFETSVYYEGEILDSVLYGHLFVVGGCDPDFTSEDLEVLTSKIKDLGINKITGNIFGDVSMMDSLFWGNGWMWDDYPSTDAPYMSALNINDNAVTIACEYDNQNNQLVVRSIPETNFVEVIKKVTSDDTKPAELKVDRDWINRANKFFVEGNINNKFLQDENLFVQQFNILKPELYFLTLFRESLERSNIKFAGELKFKALPLNTNHIFSFMRSYDSVIVNLNKTSDNLSAEMVLRALAERHFGKPASALNGIKMIDSLIILCGLYPSDYRLVDGSGVSHYNLVTAELILSVLKYFYYNEPILFQTLYDSFPNAGVDGSLEWRMRNTKAQNNVHAKTGTLSGVSALSGYLKNKKDHMLAFSIIIQNYVGSSKQARDFIDSICVILSESN